MLNGTLAAKVGGFINQEKMSHAFSRDQNSSLPQCGKKNNFRQISSTYVTNGAGDAKSQPISRDLTKSQSQKIKFLSHVRNNFQTLKASKQKEGTAYKINPQLRQIPDKMIIDQQEKTLFPILKRVESSNKLQQNLCETSLEKQQMQRMKSKSEACEGLRKKNNLLGGCRSNSFQGKLNLLMDIQKLNKKSKTTIYTIHCLKKNLKMFQKRRPSILRL